MDRIFQIKKEGLHTSEELLIHKFNRQNEIIEIKF